MILSLAFIVSCMAQQQGNNISDDKTNCDYTQAGRFYAGRNPQECIALTYKCADFWQSFQDDCGCGCVEIDPQKWLDSVWNNPPVSEVDISQMTPFVIDNDSVKVKFYLRENQKMEMVDSKIHFNMAGIAEPLPISFVVEGYHPDKCTLSGSGCSLSKKGTLYIARVGSSNEFTISVSVKRKDNTSIAVASFKFVIVSDSGNQ
jgi:hypothetical protein